MTALLAKRIADAATCACCGEQWPAEFRWQAEARLRANPDIAHDPDAEWVFICPACEKAGRQPTKAGDE